MDTKMNIAEHANAELSQETLSQITAGAVDAFIYFQDYKGGYLEGETQ